jgi:hypothetical protein
MDVSFGKTNLIETVFPGGNFAKVPTGIFLASWKI